VQAAPSSLWRETPPPFFPPYNVNAQSIRTRSWDGKDNFFSDNVAKAEGESSDPGWRPVSA